MFITVATTEHVIQASDRRISLFRDGEYVTRDDDTNKAIIVDCHLAYFTLTYSGLAEVGRTRTDIAIAEDFGKSIRDSKSPKELFDRFIRSFERRRNKARVYRLPKDMQKTDIVAAGFLSSGPLFFTLISNCRDRQNIRGELRKGFSIDGSVRAKPTRKDRRQASFVFIGGIDPNQSFLLHMDELLKLRRSRYFHRVSGPTVAAKLVQIIREYGNSSASGELVGPHCESVVLNGPPSTVHQFEYHKLGGCVVQFGPTFVGRGGGVLANFETGPLPQRRSQRSATRDR